MKFIPDYIYTEILKRVESIKELMRKEEVDAILVASNSNIYYTTGRFFRGYTYIALDKEPLWFIIKPEFFDSDNHAFYIRKPEQIPDYLIKNDYNLPKKIGLDFDTIPYSEIIRYQKIFPGSEYVNGSSILIRSRMIKTEWEIERMMEDGIHQSEAYRRVSKCYKEGMTDIEFQIEIERILRLEGCLGIVRTAGNLMEINLGSVIVGDNADNPGPYDFTMGGEGVDPSLPVGANGSPIKRGQAIMIDMNGSFNGYQTDMTRVWRLGEIPALAYKAHDCSSRILRALEKEAVPGVPIASLYEIAMEIVKKEGLEEYFMGHSSHVSFIGHGVGIELNEPPVIMKKSRDHIQENMTIALEPKFVIPGVGAVGIENTYLVKQTGLVSLTKFPEEIAEL